MLQKCFNNYTFLVTVTHENVNNNKKVLPLRAF